MATSQRYTPTETRILSLLSDGQGHTKQEIFDECIEDDLARLSAINPHIMNLRRKLQDQGQTIALERNNDVGRYRIVRLLANPYKE